MKIMIDHSKCTGCKMCEIACSLQHTGTVNPWRARIRVFLGENFCLPVIAGRYKEAGCNARESVLIEGHEVPGCVVCAASCPIKSVYKDPDTGKPLRCDFCGGPPGPGPQCVQWCDPRALTLVKGSTAKGSS